MPVPTFRSVLSLLSTLIALPVAAQSLKAHEVYSSMAVSVIAALNPVLGADNRRHLAFELLAVNPTNLYLTLDKVEVVDPAGSVLSNLAGDALASSLVLTGGGTRLAPGTTGYVFLDVAFAAGAVVPTQVAPRITLTRQHADPAGHPVPYPATEPLPATVTFTAAPVTVGAAPAIVVAPPLRGKNWVAVNGCCDVVTSHRGAIMAINGRLRVPERFAIDWLQLDAQDRLYTGPVGTLTSYAFFGVPVHSVADGTVVNLYDQAAEQVPGSPAKGITPESIGGNMLVIDIGGGHYAFYAHLQPGSLKVKLGDKVKTGDVLALLGNTGNSDAPHLHFHVMDGSSPLDADSLPYVFTQFTGAGMLDEASFEAMIDKGAPGIIDRKVLSGLHRNQLPLNNEVVDFGP